MTTEKDYRKALYEFFEFDLLQHNKERMQKQACLVIEGLKTGKGIANNKTKSNGEYSYKEAYYAAVYCKNKILTSFRTKQFEDETGKVRYACAIIRNNINTISQNLKERDSAEKKVISMPMDNLEHDAAEYVRKSENVMDSKLEELW